MASSDAEISHRFRFFTIYKDGRVKLRRPFTEKIPPSDDPVTGVRSKDVIISSEPLVSTRIFLLPSAETTQKLPLLFYVHGGGFCMDSTFSPRYHNFLSTFAAEANVIAVSVEYGMFPTRPIPACYDDSWVGLQWVASHCNRNGPEPWLNDHADFQRVFIAGDSAGGNISHTLAVRVGSIGLPGVKVVGVVLVHPYFGPTKDDQMWLQMCPVNGGLEDPRMRPNAADLARLGCERVLIFVAEKDHYMAVGKHYYEELKKCGWGGSAEIVENSGEKHCFHLVDLKYEKSLDLIKKFVSFVKQDKVMIARL